MIPDNGLLIQAIIAAIAGPLGLIWVARLNNRVTRLTAAEEAEVKRQRQRDEAEAERREQMDEQEARRIAAVYADNAELRQRVEALERLLAQTREELVKARDHGYAQDRTIRDLTHQVKQLKEGGRA